MPSVAPLFTLRLVKVYWPGERVSLAPKLTVVAP
jgi:hypothetical protein